MRAAGTLVGSNLGDELDDADMPDRRERHARRVHDYDRFDELATAGGLQPHRPEDELQVRRVAVSHEVEHRLAFAHVPRQIGLPQTLHKVRPPIAAQATNTGIEAEVARAAAQRAQIGRVWVQL